MRVDVFFFLVGCGHLCFQVTKYKLFPNVGSTRLQGLCIYLGLCIYFETVVSTWWMSCEVAPHPLPFYPGQPPRIY